MTRCTDKNCNRECFTLDGVRYAKITTLTNVEWREELTNTLVEDAALITSLDTGAEPAICIGGEAVSEEYPQCYETADGAKIAVTVRREIVNGELTGVVEYQVRESTSEEEPYMGDILSQADIDEMTRIQCVPCCSNLPEDAPVEPVPPELRLRAALLGAMLDPIQDTAVGVAESSPTMRTDLLTKGIIPLTSPYASGATTTQAILTANNIVDWVEVHVFIDGEGTTYDMLMKSDGYLITPEGNNIVLTTADTGKTVTEVSVNHRNHMGATVVTNEVLAEGVNTIDTMYGDYPFWSAAATTRTKDEYWYKMSDGGYALWAGDTNGNNQIKAQGIGTDANGILGSVVIDPANPTQDLSFISRLYSVGDLSLSGYTIGQPDQVTVDGVTYSSDVYILNNLIYHYPTNTTQQINFPFATSEIKLP